jgi:hypothetical protein
MKRTIIFLSMLAMVLSFQDAHAQSIRSLMKKKIIEDNLKAQAKRDSARAVEEDREPDKSPNTTMNQVYMDALGLSGNVDYETSYNFNAYIQMEVSEYKKNGKLDNKVVYDSYVSKEAFDYAMVFTDGRDESTIIFDDKNDAMLILSESDGEKTGFAMGMDVDAMVENAEDYAEEEAESSPYAPYKTGKTKTIMGYSCDEYLITDENSEARMWVSEKLGKQVRKEILANNHTFGAAFYHAAYMNGMVLEYDFLDKDDGERVVMQVTDIDLNKSHSISTRGYTVMSMGQQPEPEE